MNPRQRFALTHPLNRASDALNPVYRRKRKHPTGVELTVMLAVDR